MCFEEKEKQLVNVNNGETEKRKFERVVKDIEREEGRLKG